MPAILKPEVYKKWLDPQNRNMAELVDLLEREIITEMVSDPLPKHTGAARRIDPSRTEAAGKARQTTFVWPRHKGPSDKG